MKKILFALALFAHLISQPAFADPPYRYSQENSLVELAERAIPTVVFVAIEQNWFDHLYAQNEDSYYQTFPYLYEIFRPIYESFWPPSYGHGSGFFIDSDGHIVTNHHVVGSASKVYVSVIGGKKRVYEASVVGKDFRTDLAVIKLNMEKEESFPYVEFGDSSRVQVGEQVVAIGNPVTFRLEHTLTQGVVSGLNRNRFSPLEIEGYIQTDCAIHGGNSGGPLFNLYGEVIGVNSCGIAGASGLNFAIPSNTTARIAHQLIENGEVSNGFLGIRVEPNTEKVFNYFLFDSPGVKIAGVIRNSPASHAGLKKGDLIHAVDALPIQSEENIRNYFYPLKPETVVNLTIERDGELREITVTLTEDDYAITKYFWRYIQGYGLVL